MLIRMRCLSLLLAALLPVIAACQADGDPSSEATESDGEPATDNDTGGDNLDGGDNNEDDEDTANDNNDDDDTTENNPTADCDTRAEFLPLTKGIRQLDLKLKAKAEIDDACRHCEIRDEDAVVEPNLLKSARMMTPAGVLDGVSLYVELDEERYGIDQAGFMVAAPDGALSDAILENIELSLLRDDRTTERAQGGQAELTIYETSDSYRQLLIVDTNEAFDAIRIRMNGDGENSAVLDVYAACVNHYGWEDDDDDDDD